MLITSNSGSRVMACLFSPPPASSAGHSFRFLSHGADDTASQTDVLWDPVLGAVGFVIPVMSHIMELVW